MRSRALARRPPRDYSERRMRIVKVLALLAPLIILILGLSTLRPHDAVWAQLPTPNPMVGPRPLPSAPAQLPAPVSTLVAPPLAPVPAPPTPAPPVTARYGSGSSPNFLRRTASSAQRMPVLQRATRAATRDDSAAVERRSGVLVGAIPAGRVSFGRGEDGESGTTRTSERVDGSAAPGVPDLHMRLARFDVNKI